MLYLPEIEGLVIVEVKAREVKFDPQRNLSDEQVAELKRWRETGEFVKQLTVLKRQTQSLSQ